ncbi:MAG: hypothetical protein ACLUNV_03845 [Sutterella wadsworthensis]
MPARVPGPIARCVGRMPIALPHARGLLRRGRPTPTEAHFRSRKSGSSMTQPAMAS